MSYPCGKCDPCKKKRAAEWVRRLRLELDGHRWATFITLTYADQHYHPIDIRKAARIREMQLFLKRLRKLVEPRELRYFGVAEFGDTFGRLHYHYIIYGLGAHETEVIRKAWKKGYIYAVPVNAKLMAYTVGYVAKKLVKTEERACTLMSLKPGIGANCVEGIVKFYRSPAGRTVFAREGWIHRQIRIDQNGKAGMPRYIYEKTLEGLGITQGQKNAYRSRLAFREYLRRNPEELRSLERAHMEGKK